MGLRKALRGRGRLARGALTTGLAFVAIRSLRRGKRVTGALAGAGAVALGYKTAADSGELQDALEIEAPGGDESSAESRESATLHCAACGDPIVPGQARGPNADGEIVHEDCES